MDAVLNNPFRILGLEPTIDERIISERVSEILMLLTNGEKTSFPIDEFYDRILVDPYNTLYYNNLSDDKGIPVPIRNIETVKLAYEKLQNPIKRKYYALFAFEFEQSLNGKDADDIIEALESKLQIKEKRINKFSHTTSSDFLNRYSEVSNSEYIIEKDYNSLKVTNLIENGSFLKPSVIIDKISQEESFSLEFECKWIEGIDNNSFSVFWGKDTFKSNYYSFGISGNGYFSLSNIEDGKRKENDVDFIGWKKCDAIKQHGHNHLEFRRNMDCIEFYINYTLVHQTNTFRKFYGEDHGFIVFGKQTVVFSDLKINSYKEDIDYASNLIISTANFEKVKNLALHFFFKTYLSLNQPLTYTSSKSDIKNVAYAPSNLHLSLDKALILFGKLFQKHILLSIRFFRENTETENFWKDLANLFFDDLGQILDFAFDKDREFKGINFKERFEDITLRKIRDEYSLANLETNYLNWKTKLLQFPRKTDYEDDQFDIDLFRHSKISKSHFSSSINNPFRILGLKHDAKDKEIVKRVSDLLVYVEMGKKPKYETDLFFGEINRTIENIREAEKKLDNPNQKLYYSLLWFIELNELDKAFIKKIQALDNGENTIEFKRDFIRLAPEFLESKINYFDAIRKVYGIMFCSARRLIEEFIDDLQKESEKISFCLYDDLVSSLPLNNNSIRINNQIVLNSNTDEGFCLLKDLFFDYTVDYEIKFECEWLEGEDTDKLYSIIFSKDLENNYYSFGMTANGTLVLDAFVNGKCQNLISQRYSGNNKLKRNLKISYNSEVNEFRFYFNENVLPKTYFSGLKALKTPLIGNTIGVSVIGKQKVSFSNIKFSYTHRISKNVSKFKIRPTNISSVINYMTANLCCSSFMEFYYYYLPVTITLFGKIINTDYFHSFASEIAGEYGNIDQKLIEKYFIDDIYSFTKLQFDKNENIKLNEFIDAFYSFSDMNQNYIVHKFIGRPILDIEDSIAKTKKYLKITPLQGIVLGFNLFSTTNENLLTVRKILSYTNYQYRLLANNLADTLLDCGIIYFNAIRKNREVLLSEGNQILELINHANTIAIGGDVRKRVDENTVFFEKWVSDTEKKEQEKFKQEQERLKQERLKRDKLEYEKQLIERDKQIKQKKEEVRLREEQELKNKKNKQKFKKPGETIIYESIWDRHFFQKLVKMLPTILVLAFFAIIIFFAVKPQEVSKWKGNKLQNGISPYEIYFGEGIYNYSSQCYIIFKNGNATDAVVCLENAYTGSTIRNEYIQAGTNYKMSNVPVGIYKFKVFSGNDWNPEKTLKNGLIRGAFDTDLNFSLSDNSKDLININITATGYSYYEITLYTVSNGNMSQRKINDDEFFK